MTVSKLEGRVSEVKLFICPECHQPIARYIQTEKGTQLVIGGKPMGAIMRGNRIKQSDGTFGVGYPVSHQVGRKIHLYVISDSGEQIMKEKENLFNFKKPCPFHENPEAICNQKKACTDCIVYENRHVIIKEG